MLRIRVSHTRSLGNIIQVWIDKGGRSDFAPSIDQNGRTIMVAGGGGGPEPVLTAFD